MIERLALGTVQFGVAYGIANVAGRPSRDEVAAIIGAARRSGIDTLDTAIAYGESEQRLGEVGVADWRVVTKLPALPDGVRDAAGWAERQLEESLARLRVSSVEGLLLHRSSDLLGAHGPALADALRRMRSDGRVARIGVSIYDPSELELIWPSLVPDLVQAPYSVVDRRLDASGWLARLHAAGVEVHARSAFLQGLLLMSDASRPPRFERWSMLWRAWSRWVAEHGASPLSLALGHVLALPAISRVVVGVDTEAQLREIVAAASLPARTAPPELSSTDPDLINPSRWTVA